MLHIEGADKLVQIVAADCLRSSFAFCNGTTGFKPVVCREVEFATGFVNVETRLLVAKGDEENRHQPTKKIPATIVIVFEDTNEIVCHTHFC